VLLALWRSGCASGLAVVLEAAPDRPDDASDLVCDGDGGLVVGLDLGEAVSPSTEVIGLFDASVEDDGTGTVNEEGSEISIAALGDASESALETAGELARSKAEPAGEVTW
jgi:hypothetical protein